MYTRSLFINWVKLKFCYSVTLKVVCHMNKKHLYIISPTLRFGPLAKQTFSTQVCFSPSPLSMDVVGTEGPRLHCVN